MKARPFILITILLLSAPNACWSALRIPEERVPPAEAPLATTESVPHRVFEGKDAADLSAETPRPEIRIAAEVEALGAPQQVVIAFLNAISEGKPTRALDFWKPEIQDEGIRRMVAGWASGKHEFVVGAASYAGFVAPGDYRPLEAADPRVQDVLVAASIAGAQGSFALEKTSTGWLISAWIVSDDLTE